MPRLSLTNFYVVSRSNCSIQRPVIGFFLTTLISSDPVPLALCGGGQQCAYQLEVLSQLTRVAWTVFKGRGKKCLACAASVINRKMLFSSSEHC